MHEVLGHERCAAAGGDFGGGVIQDLGLRFEGFVERQVLFNTVLRCCATSTSRPASADHGDAQAADYFRRQGRDADALAAELDTPDGGVRYIAQFYGQRLLGRPGAFHREDVDFMTEPFADADALRAWFGIYESALGTRPLSEPPRLFETSPVPTVVLYGPEDHVIGGTSPALRGGVRRVRRTVPRPRRRPFLQWERAELLNRTLAAFLL